MRVSVYGYCKTRLVRHKAHNKAHMFYFFISIAHGACMGKTRNEDADACCALRAGKVRQIWESNAVGATSWKIKKLKQVCFAITLCMLRCWACIIKGMGRISLFHPCP